MIWFVIFAVSVFAVYFWRQHRAREREMNSPGAGAPAGVTPNGISLDYEVSFSAHQLSTTSNRKAVKVAKRCRRQRGRLKVKKARGGKKKLVCARRPRRR